MDEDIIPHDTRTREERQLDCLRDHLARPNWSGGETFEILAGLDPELSGGRGKGEWWLLPGTPSNLHEYEMEDRFCRLGGIDALRQTVRPVEAIRAALVAGFVPPWLDIAKGDPACRTWLPPELFGEPPLSILQVASRGGKATAAKGEKAKLREACEPVILAMLRENPKVKGLTIIKALEEKFGADRISDSTAYGWIETLRPDAVANGDSNS